MHALLVMNPAAGGSTQHRLEQLERAAATLGCALDIAMPESPAAADQIVRDALDGRCDRILVAGGDGTINRVASTLAGTDVPLAIIPTGTVNVLARELRIPLDPVKALKVALTGRTRRIDIGTANDRAFLLMAGLGFDAQVVSQYIPRVKELFGSLAYITTGLQVLTRYKPSLFLLEADGNAFSVPAWLIVVGNASYYGYQFAITPRAQLDDGMLDVCLFAEHTSLDRLMQVSAFLAGQHLKHPNVSYFRVRRLKVLADPPVHLQLDGDPVGMSPVDIGIRPAALQIVCA